jgi:hypothetical protein
MAVTAFANAMRIQSMIGITSLIIEGEMFGQPTLRAIWKNEYGGRPEDIKGLAVEHYVAHVRDRLLLLAVAFHAMAREAIESINRLRRSRASAVERAAPIKLCS